MGGGVSVVGSIGRRGALAVAGAALECGGPAWAAGPRRPVTRAGALEDIPTNLPEIGWDTDLPALLVIRYLPQRMSFSAGWSSWALAYWFHLTRAMRWPQPDPWPPFFVTAGARASDSSGLVLGWPEAQQQQFQAWCIKRSRVVPPVIVHAVTLVPAGGAALVLRPFGLGPDTPRAEQRVVGLGFSLMISLGLGHDAEQDAVTVPAGTVAGWPASGLTLETRVRWSEPVREDGSLFFAGQALSLRVVHGGVPVWQHAYGEGPA